MQIYYANHPELKGDAIVNCFGISENGSTVVEPIGFREDLQFDKMPKGFMDRTIRNYGLLRKSLAAIEKGGTKFRVHIADVIVQLLHRRTELRRCEY